MPSQTALRLLTKKTDNTFVTASQVPVSAQSWSVGGEDCWAVIPANGQATPTVGQVATYIDPAQPWVGAGYSTPTPTYPPLPELQAMAIEAVAAYADGLLEIINGRPVDAAAGFSELRQLETLDPASMTPEQAARFTTLLAAAALNESIDSARKALDAWISACSSQETLHTFVQNGLAADPAAMTGIGWPQVA